jgi:D-3-phosphoglycerate dehydrogenase / 2-oxoglutarate reductase
MAGKTDAAQTVVIADYDYTDVDIEQAILQEAGLRLVAAQCKTEDDVISAASEADAIIAQYATVGARAIGALTRCRVIARYGTGVDIVDVDAATRHGILVTNVPNAWCLSEVADHAMALLLAVARKICVYDRATHIITPHAAYYSEESITTVREFAAQEVVRVLTGKPPLSPVNASQLADLR